jgi:catechol 2,3-dioxygenase
MVTRVGHVALHVADLERSIAFFQAVLGLRVTERMGDRAYLTCNDRHHELILIGSGRCGYDHVGLEVADSAALERMESSLRGAGARVIGFQDEPGIDRALRVVVTGGHVLKLFAGMRRVPDAGDRDAAVKFEHVSLNLRNLGGIEKTLIEGLGFRVSDRVGRMLSWLRCDGDHHSVALTRYPVTRLHHYAWSFPDLESLGRAADRAAGAGARLVYGLGRHGPGDNHFIYLKDPDGFLIECCANLAQLGPGSTYELGRKWTVAQTNLWGPRASPAFLTAGRPVAR